MSAILDFYRGAKHPRGLTFEEALALPNTTWESCHDFVQWFFPLPEPSKMHPDAPTLSIEEFQAFHDDVILRANLRKAVARYERFLKEYWGWRRPQDHNHLRITRVIRCMVLAGMAHGAEDFYDSVHAILGNTADILPQATLAYWREALHPHPAWLKEAP